MMKRYYVVQKLTRIMTEDELRRMPLFANLPEGLTTVAVGPLGVEHCGERWECETTVVLQGEHGTYNYSMTMVDAEGNPVESEDDETDEEQELP